MPHLTSVLSQSVPCPFSISQPCPMSYLKLSQKCVPSQTCPVHVPGMSRTCPQNVPVLIILGHIQKCPESAVLCPFSISQTYPMYFFKLAQKCVPSRTCHGRVPDMSRACPQNVPVLTILGHLQIGRVQLRCTQQAPQRGVERERVK